MSRWRVYNRASDLSEANLPRWRGFVIRAQVLNVSHTCYRGTTLDLLLIIQSTRGTTARKKGQPAFN